MWQCLKITTYCLLLTLPGALCCAADQPYLAMVNVDEAELVSSPQSGAYATHRLAKGTLVEVYQKQGSWLGIRPPEGSFSWIDDKQVQMTDEPGLAEVIEEGASSWVGSEVEKIARHQAQVQLPVGEKLEVLGKKPTKSADGENQLWLKITPPAGEFRWIHASEVRRYNAPQPEPELAAKRTKRKVIAAASEEVLEPEPAPEPARPAAISTLQQSVERARELLVATDLIGREPGRFQPMENAMPLDALEPPAPLPPAKFSAAEQDQIAVSGYDDPRTVTTPPPRPNGDGFVARKRRTADSVTSPMSGADNRMASNPRRAPSLAPSSLGNAAIPQPPASRLGTGQPPSSNFNDLRTAPAVASSNLGSSPATAGSVRQKLDDIDLELSLMLSRPKETWNLVALQKRVEALVDNGGTPTDRGQARLMLDKLREFQRTFDVPESPTGSRSTGLGGIERVAGPANNSPRYDGSGWLKPVFSRDATAAPYALVDAEGNRICFVSPAPGLNLNRYVDKEIGLYGRRGFIEAINAPHLTAQRVIDLDRHRR